MAAWVDLTTFRNFVRSTKPEDDPSLQAAINLGCDKVDELCGPTITTSITERVRGEGYDLPLDARATAITSIATWPDGTVLDAAAYYVDDQLLARRDGGWIDSDLTVTYTAGAATAPSWAVSAACLIGKQWYTSRLQPSQNDPTAMVGFLVPKQATEIMADHLLAPDGFA